MADSKRRILVVEDDEAVRELVARHLEGEGYAVTRAADAEEVLLRMSRDREPYDLVLSDVHLPGLSGVELLRLLLTHSPLRPVILITGDDDEALARRALEDGATGYLLKPFQMFELDGAVRQAMARVELVEANEKLARTGAGRASGTVDGEGASPDGGTGVPEAWLALADTRSEAGAGHGHRVARLAGVLASSLGEGSLDPGDHDTLDTAARVHELGRLLGPAAGGAELAGRTTQLLRDLGAAPGVVRTVSHMRERWDGSGGPERLEGEAVPLLARLLSAADRLDHAATSHLSEGREPGAAIGAAVEELSGEAPEQHGPDVAEALALSGNVVEAIWVLARGTHRSP
ncbi:MAG TPA: response regulator [Longimicrobiales bacterium]|nr:response regulator [Longimicrobiales bacterium]